MPNIRPLNAELQKAAIEQLNEVPERIDADLETLKTWIKQQPHLRARTDDQFLMAFLRGCKYSLEKAKSKIDKFYAMRTKYPELFTCYDVDSPRFRELLRLGVHVYLPTPLHDNGPRIIIMRLGRYSVEKYSIEEVVHLSIALQEISLIEDDYALVNGIVLVSDMADVTTAHMMKMTPSIMQKTSIYSEDAIPIRPKGAHVVNTPSWFESVFNLLKPMLPKKMQDRFYVHDGKMESLHQQIPKKYLPKEYGGENGSIDEILAEWEKKFDEYRQFFKDNANYGTDEKLRPGKPIDYEAMFGSEGSFRKLNVD